jgi:hypothetical protein
MFGKSSLTAAVGALAALGMGMPWRPPLRRRAERSYVKTSTRYLRKTKGWTGNGPDRPFKGSSAAKRPARLAQKRAKVSRRAATREKWLAARFGATRVETRHAINGGRA